MMANTKTVAEFPFAETGIPAEAVGVPIEEQETVAPETVLVPRTVLKQFIDLAEGLEQADKAYKACQAEPFRSFTQSAYKAANVQAAVQAAKEALEQA
jgi:hypothetical protein